MNKPTEALVRVESAAIPSLVLPRPLPRDQHPALVYLARLGPGSRRTMGNPPDQNTAALKRGSMARDRGLREMGRHGRGALLSFG